VAFLLGAALLVPAPLLAASGGVPVSEAALQGRDDILYFLDFDDQAAAGEWYGTVAGYGWTAEPANVLSGAGALEIQQMQGTHQPSEIAPEIDETDVAYVRWYRKWEEGYDFTQHKMPGVYARAPGVGGGGAGIKPNGYDKYSCKLFVTFDAQPRFYTYNPDQAGEYGDELPNNIGERITLQAGRWYCFEMMIKANDAPAQDGELKMWIDGELVGHYTGMRFRDTNDLRINEFTHSAYVGGTWTSERDQKLWDDQIVVARDYIGPIGQPVGGSAAGGGSAGAGSGGKAPGAGGCGSAEGSSLTALIFLFAAFKWRRTCRSARVTGRRSAPRMGYPSRMTTWGLPVVGSIALALLAACGSGVSGAGAGDGGSSGGSGGGSAGGGGGTGTGSGGAGAVVTYGQTYEGGMFHRGPVEWAGSIPNACAPYSTPVQQAEGTLLAGLWGGIPEVASYCDACIHVVTAQGKSTVLRVVTYGDTSANSIDVSPEAYAILNSDEWPRDMTWQFAKCPDTGKVIYEFKEGVHDYWTAFWVRNARVPLTKIEVKSPHHPEFLSLSHEGDGSLVDYAGFGAGSFTIRLTAMDGQQITDAFDWPAAGLSSQVLTGHANFQ
jgi:expansin (peptidoglycan-binding protein)